MNTKQLSTTVAASLWKKRTETGNDMHGW